MLMFSPPLSEDPRPFVHVAQWLIANDMRAPKIVADDLSAGWILTEDFGDNRMKEWLDRNPEYEVPVYKEAIDTSFSFIIVQLDLLISMIRQLICVRCGYSQSGFVPLLVLM